MSSISGDGIAAATVAVQLTDGSWSRSGVSGTGCGFMKLRPASMVGLRPQKRIFPPAAANSIILSQAEVEITSQEGMMSVP